MDLDDEELEATKRLNRVAKDSNIEEEKERLMKSLNYELDKIMTRSSKVETATEILNLRQPITYMFLNLLSEREADKKRIKELEEEKEELLENYNLLEKAYITDNIPKSVVKDRIKELKLSGGSNGKDSVENLSRELAIEILEELLEDK